MSESLPTQESPAAWKARARDDLRAAQTAWERAGRPEFGPAAEAVAAATFDAQRLAGFTPSPAEAGLPWYRPLTCGHTGADRRCLACGWVRCAACQPASQGAACGRCGGPVYAEGETRPARSVNPEMGSY